MIETKNGINYLFLNNIIINNINILILILTLII